MKFIKSVFVGLMVLGFGLVFATMDNTDVDHRKTKDVGAQIDEMAEQVLQCQDLYFRVDVACPPAEGQLKAFKSAWDLDVLQNMKDQRASFQVPNTSFTYSAALVGSRDRSGAWQLPSNKRPTRMRCEISFADFAFSFGNIFRSARSTAAFPDNDEVLEGCARYIDENEMNMMLAAVPLCQELFQEACQTTAFVDATVKANTVLGQLKAHNAYISTQPYVGP